MGKTEEYQNILNPLFSEFFIQKNPEKLKTFLISNSNLPGRRANLELAKAFVLMIEKHIDEFLDHLWPFIIDIIHYDVNIAPTNDPQEFLVFCGTWGLGVVTLQGDEYYNKSLKILKKMANDSRWRIREAVAKAIHITLMSKGEEILQEIILWIESNNWLTMRAVAAGVAEPKILANREIALASLEFHKLIFDHILKAEDRNTENFKILRKGLAYTLSVIVAALPEEGFEFITELANIKDSDIRWILKQNLNKNRLSRNYPLEVQKILKRLN